jgi:hypothetical protein
MVPKITEAPRDDADATNTNVGRAKGKMKARTGVCTPRREANHRSIDPRRLFAARCAARRSLSRRRIFARSSTTFARDNCQTAQESTLLVSCPDDARHSGSVACDLGRRLWPATARVIPLAAMIGVALLVLFAGD